MLHFSDGRPAVGMEFVQIGFDFFIPFSVGAVVITHAFFLFDHLVLGVHSGLIDDGMEHALGFHPKAQLEIVGRKIFVVIGEIIGGISIVGTSVSGDDTEPFPFGDVFGAFKQEMLKEMRKTCSSRIFILRTHMIEY